MLSTEYYLDSTFLMTSPMILEKCELFWVKLISKKQFKSKDVEFLMFTSSNEKKNQISHDNILLYDKNSFMANESTKSIMKNIQERDNILICGSANTGKSQFVVTALTDYFKNNKYFR